jgi:hypothetical protein
MPAPRLNPVFRARIERGEVRWFGIEGKRFDVLKRKFEGKDVEVVLRLPQKKSTGPQRRYYWPVIVGMICEAAGYGPEHAEAIHEALKLMFLAIPGDGPIKVARSTESLTTVEREEYHNNCRRFGAEEFGIYIPLPNEVDLEGITA